MRHLREAHAHKGEACMGMICHGPIDRSWNASHATIPWVTREMPAFA
jgi:hypothetical protein